MDRVVSHARWHTVAPSRALIESIVLFPFLSTLALRQGTIIPHQLWKHGFGNYPLDISGETAPALQVLAVEVALTGRYLVVSCWYYVIVELWVETRRRKRPTGVEKIIKNVVRMVPSPYNFFFDWFYIPSSLIRIHQGYEFDITVFEIHHALLEIDHL